MQLQYVSSYRPRSSKSKEDQTFSLYFFSLSLINVDVRGEENDVTQTLAAKENTQLRFGSITFGNLLLNVQSYFILIM